MVTSVCRFRPFLVGTTPLKRPRIFSTGHTFGTAMHWVRPLYLRTWTPPTTTGAFIVLWVLDPADHSACGIFPPPSRTIMAARNLSQDPPRADPAGAHPMGSRTAPTQAMNQGLCC